MMPVNMFIHGTSPLPKAAPRLGKRRTQFAEHLTSSPYKDFEKNTIKMWKQEIRMRPLHAVGLHGMVDC
jgi:hypothetical protein